MYNDVTVYGTVKSKSENTDFTLSFWSPLTHGLRAMLPEFTSACQGLSGERSRGAAHCWALPGARQPWQRADETISHVFACEEDLSLQKCFVSQKKSWAAVWRVRARQQMKQLCIPYPVYLLLSLSWFILAHQGLSCFTQVTQVTHPDKIKLDPPKLALTTISPLSFVFSYTEGKQEDEVKICIVLFLHKPSNLCSRGILVLPQCRKAKDWELFGGNTQ